MLLKGILFNTLINIAADKSSCFMQMHLIFIQPKTNYLDKYCPEHASIFEKKKHAENLTWQVRAQQQKAILT